jgi:hypothetical protein
MAADVIRAVDEAIGFTSPPGTSQSIKDAPAEPAGENVTEEPDLGEQDDVADPAADKLLDRLLYWGVLPRYAFPTDVAPFYVFNRALSTPFRPKMEFAPTQGLNIALSQYAPNKQIWIKGKQYTSKAIYSPYLNERRDAWSRRRLYFECSRCGHAKTEDYAEERQNLLIECEACRSPGTFGPAKRWFRPPGFAHPIDRDPVSSPDSPNETAYATRAKLVMPTPAPDTGWFFIGSRVRAFPTRKHLLVSNSGPDGDGYDYCTGCGRIEAVADPEVNLSRAHTRPHPSDEEGPCPGYVARRIVLGTDFRTDIALFSLPLDSPFRVRAGNDETDSALRTICEALAKAACRVLQIESTEILAEYRPALTDEGANGLEAEVFIYDTLAGGAGFSPQLVGCGQDLFDEALNILTNCPEGCDASCYRCLRSFRNKLDHRLLDRKLGEQLLRHTLYGGYPAYPHDRTENSLNLLFDDVRRQLSDQFELERKVDRADRHGYRVTVPIVVRRRSNKEETWVTLASPIAPDLPVDADLRAVAQLESGRIVCIDDLLVRRNFPAAIKKLFSSLR